MKYVQMFFAALFFSIAAIVSVFTGFIPVLILKLFRLNRAADFWTRVNVCGACSVALFFLGVKIHVQGKEKLPKGRGKRICYIANHTSFIDVPGLMCTFFTTPCFVAKRELAAIPIINMWMWAMDCVFLKRASVEDSIRAVNKAVAEIKSGRPVFIFPEGTRSKTGKIAPFKKGSFKLVSRSSATMVPIVIKSFRPSFEGKTRMGTVHVNLVVGDPVETAGMDPNEKTAAYEAVEAWINEVYDSLPDTKG